MTISAVMPKRMILPKGLGYIEFTDMFCGAGGSSNGLEYVPGIIVTQCINHDRLAIEAHNKNFPYADHDQQDIWATPAARFRRTQGLWASPSCTHHAFCRGPKSETEEADRSRATMWCVCRFTDHHRYDVVIVENVVEARLWCDYKSHGKKCSCGRTFDDWYRKMEELGYQGQIVYFNSQFALPTPQSRDRMYVVFWRNGVRKPNLDFRPVSWCSSCETVVKGVQTWKKASKSSLRAKIFEWGRYGQQYTYTCPDCRSHVAPAVVGARSAIDFSNLGERIADRERPLAVKTRRRIKVGLERLMTTEPVTVHVGGHLYERPGYARVWSVKDPMRTVTTTNYTALVTPLRDGSIPADADQPTPALTQRSQMGFVVRYGGQAPSPRILDEPTMAITAHDRQIGVVTKNDHLLLQLNRGGAIGDEPSRSRTVDRPTPTITGAHRGELGIVSLRNHGDMTPIEKPAPTVVGGGHHHGLLVYNGSPGFVRSLDDAAGTVTARDKQSLLVPYFGNAEAAYTTEKPMGALTGKDRSALVITESDIDECFFRMLKWPELLKAQHMHIKGDGTPYLLEARRQDARGKWKDLSDELRVKYIGNAVSSTVAEMIGRSVVEALT